MDSYESSSESDSNDERSSSPRSRGRTLASPAQRYGSILKRKPLRSYPPFNPIFVDTAGPRVGAVPGHCLCHPAIITPQTAKLVGPIERALAPAGEGRTSQASFPPQTVRLGPEQLHGRRNPAYTKVRQALLPVSHLRQGDRSNHW